MRNSLSSVSLLFFWKNGFIDDDEYRLSNVALRNNEFDLMLPYWRLWWAHSVIYNETGFPDHIWDSEDGWLPVSLLS